MREDSVRSFVNETTAIFRSIEASNLGKYGSNKEVQTNLNKLGRKKEL